MLNYRNVRASGTEGIARHILNVGSSRKRVFSFTTRLLYPRRKVTHLVVSQVGPSGHSSEEKRRCTHWESSNAGRPVRNMITLLSELSLLLCMIQVFQRMLARSVYGSEYVCDHRLSQLGSVQYRT